MNIEPLGNRILFLITPPKETTEGGIVVPNAKADSAFREATIMELGPDCIVLKKGEKVLLNNIPPRAYIKEATGERNVYAILPEDHVPARIRQKA